MLSQIYRFHGHGSLRYVYRNGHSIRGRLITVKYSENRRRKISRCSVVVSKKIAKLAVDRNRIRRRIYEIIRLQLPYIQKPHDIVVIITNSDIQQLSHEELTSYLCNQLREADILPSPTSDNSGTI